MVQFQGSLLRYVFFHRVHPVFFHLFLRVLAQEVCAMKMVNLLLRCELQPNKRWQRVNGICCVAFAVGFLAVLVIAVASQS